MATKQARINDAVVLIEELLEADWLHHQMFDEEGREILRCDFCGAEGHDKNFRHDDECTVTRARAFIKENHHA